VLCDLKDRFTLIQREILDHSSFKFDFMPFVCLDWMTGSTLCLVCGRYTVTHVGYIMYRAIAGMPLNSGTCFALKTGRQAASLI